MKIHEINELMIQLQYRVEGAETEAEAAATLQE